MIVYVFRKGICPRPFCESIIRSVLKTFYEIRRRAVEHIASEGEVCEKCTSVSPACPRALSRAQPTRVNEATTERKYQDRKRPYEARRPQTRGAAEGDRQVRKGNRPLRHNFVMELKDLIAVPNIANRLRPPVKSDKVLGPRKDSWCEFHKAFGHHINNCLALGHQLDKLVKNGFLKDYLAGPATTTALAVPEEDQAHEMPIHGEVHTISGGFSGGGPIVSQRKRHVRAVNSVTEEGSDDRWESDLVFTKADLRDVVPHDNDLVVISVVTAGRKVHRVLVDQGSSADIMFWSTFNKAKNPGDRLWVSFNGIAGRSILSIFQQSYKDWKGKFVRVCCNDQNPTLLDGFPLYWVDKGKKDSQDHFRKARSPKKMGELDSHRAGYRGVPGKGSPDGSLPGVCTAPEDVLHRVRIGARAKRAKCQSRPACQAGQLRQRGEAEDRHSGDLEGTARVRVRQPGTSCVQINGAPDDRSSVVDPRNAESTEGEIATVEDR